MPFACGDSRSRGAQGRRVWEVPLAFAEVLPTFVYEFSQRLKDEFSKTGNQATFSHPSGHPDFSGGLQAYYREWAEEESLC